jgi:hypothetical protein
MGVFSAYGSIMVVVFLVLGVVLLVVWGRENKRRLREREAYQHPPRTAADKGKQDPVEK